MNCQRSKYTEHIFCHRNKSRKTDIGKCSGDQTVHTNRCCHHDHVGHLHHDIVELRKEVGNNFDFFTEFCKYNTYKKGKYNNLKHCTICQGSNRIGWNNIQQSLSQCRTLSHRDFLCLNRSCIQAETRFYNRTNCKSNGNRQCGCEKIEHNGLHTDFTQSFRITNSCTAADQ